MSDLIINLPFPGFYDSILSGELDSVEEREAEWMVERQEEEGIAPELRLDESDFASILMDVTDYSAAHFTIAKDYVGALESIANDSLGFTLGLRFESMTSPRYYNFETDRLFAHISTETVTALFAKSAMDGHKRLAGTIKGRFTSYDGFHSSYSNDLADWLEKPVLDWDHNELGTLLGALLPSERERGESLDWAIYYALADDESFYQAFGNAVDWPAFEGKVVELRADKLEEIKADDPDYVEPLPRCPLTLDMFSDYSPRA